MERAIFRQLGGSATVLGETLEMAGKLFGRPVHESLESKSRFILPDFSAAIYRAWRSGLARFAFAGVPACGDERCVAGDLQQCLAQIKRNADAQQCAEGYRSCDGRAAYDAGSALGACEEVDGCNAENVGSDDD